MFELGAMLLICRVQGSPTHVRHMSSQVAIRGCSLALWDVCMSQDVGSADLGAVLVQHNKNRHVVVREAVLVQH